MKVAHRGTVGIMAEAIKRLKNMNDGRENESY